jgi:hypothetical protein
MKDETKINNKYILDEVYQSLVRLETEIKQDYVVRDLHTVLDLEAL